MKTIACFFAFAVAIACPAIAADPVGVSDIAFLAPERGTGISATVWYPAGAGGTPKLIGDNGVFIGAAANRDAPVAGGNHPVILLSHGGFRAAPNTDSWIATRLAREGYIVAAVHSIARGLKAHDALREIWLRPTDLSAALTALEKSAVFGGALDRNRVGALGFLLGGTSALALGGAEIHASSLAGFCDNQPDNVDCAWFSRNGVDLGTIDAGRTGMPLTDPRIRSVIAVAPEFTDAFDMGSLSSVEVPIEIVSTGSAPLDAGWARTATLKDIPDATAFDIFNECKAGAMNILREEQGDERLCAETVRPRAAIHAQLADLITSAFKVHLQSDQ